jgi:hypothetical protein
MSSNIDLGYLGEVDVSRLFEYAPLPDFPIRWSERNFMATPCIGGAKVHVMVNSPSDIAAHVWDLPNSVDNLFIRVAFDFMPYVELIAIKHYSDGIQRGPWPCRLHDDCRAHVELGLECAMGGWG